MNRVTHTKKLKSTIKFYKNSFGLHSPFLILCDPNFLFAAIDSKIGIELRLAELFKGQVYLKITQCGIKEMESIKEPLMKNALQFSKNHCQIFKCSHKKMIPSDCIVDNLKNGFKGAVATQDKKLAQLIHNHYPHIILFYIKEGLQIMSPSQKLKDKIRAEIEAKYSTTTIEMEKPSIEEEKPEE